MSFQVPNGNEKSAYVQDRFSVIAGRYDLFNDIITQWMHRYWKRFLVKKADLKPGDSALDMCCGTGDILERLQKSVGNSGTATGLDFSDGMLKVAQSRNPHSISVFVQGDAMNLPIRSNSQDAVTVGFGLRNLVNIESCLLEVMRVLKPGGRFLSLDMGKVNIPVARSVFHFYFFHIVPRIGKLIYPGETFFDYFPHSSLTFPSQEKLIGMLEEAGFAKAAYFNFHLGSTAIHYAEKPVAG
jgi:demethylmenaquinone methyltransferase/2-methoxy-6-polyprenyl-1,4-benzoquinol methylase